MLPDLATLLAFVAAVLVIAITPGPDMAFFLGRAISQGRAAGLAAVAGATTGILVHTTLVALGLSALITAAPTAYLALKIAGALYLAWLAVQAIRHGSTLTIARPTEASLAATWASGLAINLLNPKIVLFFLTFLPQFVSPDDPAPARSLLTLGLVFIVAASLVTVPMVLAADRFAAALRANPGVARAIDWVLASVFLAFAATMLLGRR
ncbi:MAG: LysE family translocator [Amaricoccus sp.]|uniref:LysE family translocator n=1 Tax=Amaricoccus sp. TaxID=1872485 RepID=UPI0039E4FD3B